VLVDLYEFGIKLLSINRRIDEADRVQIVTEKSVKKAVARSERYDPRLD